MKTDPKNVKDPIIVSGPPRSGTSLLAKILERAGVFMGFQLNDSFEDMFFVNVNEVMMDSVGVQWDRPVPRDDEAWQPPIDKYLKLFGQSDSWGGGGLTWGWKEPRTIVVWDIWKAIFEELDVDPTLLRMKRHPMDIGASLCKREQNKPDEYIHQADEDVSLEKRNPTYPAKSTRCMRMEGAVDVAMEYLNLFPDEGHKIAYEELVQEPGDALADLSEITGLAFESNAIDEISEFMNEERAFAFKNNPKSVQFWNHYSEQFVEEDYTL